MVSLSSACAFDASGDGVTGLSLGGSDSGEGDSTGGAGDSRGSNDEAGSADSSNSGTEPGTTTGRGPEDTGDATLEGSDDETSDIDTDVAVLEVSGASVFEFGISLLSTTKDETLTVVNTGAATATSIGAAALPAPFSFAGGTYPGAGGTCGQILEPGASCALVVRFQPTAPVTTVRQLVLSYDRGDGGTGMADVNLRGGGQTNNLVHNPGAEGGLTSWEIVSGNWTAECIDGTSPVSGNNCFSAGLPTSGTLNWSGLRQDIDVSQWATEIDAGEVGIVARGHARSHSQNWGDPWLFRVAFRSADENQLSLLVEEGPTSTYTWTLVEEQGNVPTGTRGVRVRVDCWKPNNNNNCDAYFDDFEVLLLPAE